MSGDFNPLHAKLLFARLAIVIPAYKTKFLREALQSIAGQTDRNFQLYVGDDASPEPVAEIVREFADKLPVKFHRFEENLGKTSLVKHWERCIRLTNEPWVWVFSDDDVMDADCVAALFQELERTHAGHDAYRFNTFLVDGNGARIVESPRHPPEESGGAFLLARWRDTRNSCLQELIFSRRAWEAAGGIPDFPLAWNSDDAFIAKLGVRRPIKTISGPRVNWRWSDANITNNASAATLTMKIRASAEFVPWALDFFESCAKAETAEAIKLTERWFFHYVSSRAQFLGLRTCLEIDALAAGAWGYRRGGGFFKGMKLNLKLGAEKIVRRLRRANSDHAKNSLPHQPQS